METSMPATATKPVPPPAAPDSLPKRPSDRVDKPDGDVDRDQCFFGNAAL
jgi:hypothetical protein